MNQSERRMYLIQTLLKERPEYQDVSIPAGSQDQKALLRALMNVRPPKEVDDTFLHIQDAYLKEETIKKHITKLSELQPIREGVYLWQGDITSLECDAIVNAANSGMTGCYVPNHRCIDNCIHTYAGVQLRLECADIMRAQGYEEPTGKAKITRAYNLPCKYVIHTVGPIVQGSPTARDRELLSSCYRSCLELAGQKGIKSIAFCCISTGEFHFPNQEAAQIAVQTVEKYRDENGDGLEVIFNVFKDGDREIYEKILG